jgi:flagellar hook-length control protein FliK
MHWEIGEEAARREQGGDEAPGNWQTRLRLILPNLGGVDAQIRLQGNQISLVLAAGSTETRELLRTSTAALRSQLDEAGLALASVGIGPAKDEAANGQTAG